MRVSPFSFLRVAYHDNRQRRRDSRRRLSRDLWLYSRNLALLPLERLLAPGYANSARRICFIVGPPRSGTTLLHQLAARYLEVGYISNAIARYWMTPLIGTMLHDRPSHEVRSSITLDSDLGGTSGPHSPHEFGFFWLWFCGRTESDAFTPEQAAQLDWRGLRRELGAVSGYLQSPLVLKNINYLDFNITLFAQALPEARFIHIARESRYVVQSIIQSRAKRYGDERIWWGVRPPGREKYLGRDPLEQAVFQCRSITAAIGRQLAALPAHLSISLEYETLIRQPAAELARVAKFVDAPLRDEEGLRRLKLDTGNRDRLDAERLRTLERLLASSA